MAKFDTRTAPIRLPIELAQQLRIICPILGTQPAKLVGDLVAPHMPRLQEEARVRFESMDAKSKMKK